MTAHGAATTLTRTRAFTLVEALVSAMVLAFAALAMTALFTAGMQVSRAQAQTAQLDSRLRSRLEYLLAHDFDQLTVGDHSATVEVSGRDYLTSWTISAAPFAPADEAKQITVRIAGRALGAIVRNPSSE